jgi:hypothetical protein
LIGREAAGFAHEAFLALAFGEIFEHGESIVRFFEGERGGGVESKATWLQGLKPV